MWFRLTDADGRNKSKVNERKSSLLLPHVHRRQLTQGQTVAQLGTHT